MMLPKPARFRAGHLAMFIVALLFSVWNVLGEHLTRHCAGTAIACPLVLAFYREVAATPVLLAAAAATVGLAAPRDGAADGREARVDAALWACVGGSLWGTQLLFLAGLAMTSADVAAIYMPLSPVLTTAFAALAGVERFDRRRRSDALKLGGVALGVAAGCVIALPNAVALVRGDGGRSAVGHVALFLSQCAQSLYTIVQPPLLRRGHPPLRVAARAYAIAAGLMVLTLLLVAPRRSAFTGLSPVDIAIIAYAAVFACAIAYGLMAWSLSRGGLEPSAVALYGTLQPPMTVVIALVTTHEALPSVRDALGGVLALAGLTFVALAERQRDAALSAEGRYESIEGHAINDDGELPASEH